MRALGRKLPRVFRGIFVFLVACSPLTSCSNGQLVSSALSAVQVGVDPDQGCTILYAADDDVALGGNNEDHTNPYTYVWFVPPEPGKYGRVYFGYEDGFPQGGVNEAGLFFDGAALPLRALSEPDGRSVYDGSIPRGNLFDKIMSESATVSEALAILDSYSHLGMDTYQLLFGDAGGNSVIVDGNSIVAPPGPFQVATNFRLSENPDPPYPSERYAAAWDRLSNAESISVELFRNILDATHQEPPGPTLYSNVYDLRNGLIYLYLHHDFENVVIIDVAAELAEGFHYHRVASLFPANAEVQDFEAEYPPVSETLIAERIVPSGLDHVVELVGDYRVGPTGERVGIYLEGGRLYFHRHSSLPIEILPEGGDRFFHLFRDGSEMGITFERDGEGLINGAVGVLYGEEFRLELPALSALPWTQ